MKRVGIVGCGSIAAVHAAALGAMENISLCAFADCKRERAEEFNRKYCSQKARVYGSLEEMLEKEKLDAVHVCTPHYLHAPMAEELLKKGISAFVEKPAAMKPDEFKRLREAAGCSAGRLGFCFQNRYNGTTCKIDELVKEGSLGEVRGMRAFVTWNRTREYYQESGWRGVWATEGGGALINQSVHTLDLILRWMGKPDAVDASMSNHHLKKVIEVEDTVEAFLEFPGQKRACFYATTAYTADAPVIMELECEKGRIFTEKDRVVVMEHSGAIRTYDCPGGKAFGKSYWGAGHGACIADFYRCLETGESFQNDVESVQNVMETMFAIYRQGRSCLERADEGNKCADAI